MKGAKGNAEREAAAEPVPAQKHGTRGRLFAVLAAAALIAAAYGGGRLQGALTLRAAKADWQREQARLGNSLEASTKALSTLKSQQALWQLNAGLSEVLADVADKNYGLARDAAHAMSALLSRALVDMDGPTAERLQPLVSLLADTGRAADTLDPETRAKAGQARALVLQVLTEPDAKRPAEPRANTPAGPSS